MRLVQNLNATGAMHSLPQSASFVGFGDNPVTSKHEIKLSFKVEGTTYQDAYFYILDAKLPFDMILGAPDCLEYGIITEPKFEREDDLRFVGGLVAKGQTEGEATQQLAYAS